ncbi:GNAT family N-acetyltransferase [Massilia sp. DWR3-1-1]|uniref:GNAT family N-acetyltransferase n=1 Tax=Massilia sp. DWR3-1-1 TaxID=2804559 RepID=UPI003CF0905B
MIKRFFDKPLGAWFAGLSWGRARPTVRVKQLEERDRFRMRKHFLSLNNDDRLLRFGTVLPDEQVIAYVGKINFERDTIYGVYNRVFKLVAVGHLAFAPKPQQGSADPVTVKEKVAEFGVSVLAIARGQGIGSKLFQRAAIHCRNADVDTLYMQCLSSNQTMMHIAKKAGMEIHREYGEADAYLRLPPPSPGTVMQEALEEQFATIDYTLKATNRAAAKLFER